MIEYRTLAALGVPHAATTRHFPGVGPANGDASPFGPDAVREAARAGLDLGRAAWARQVHGARVVRVEKGGHAGEADGLVTTAAGVPLAIFTADCLALLMVDAEAGVLAAVHAGWRGTVQNAGLAGLAALLAAGGRADRVRVAISPSIGPCCYEVDGPVRDAFAAAHPRSWERWMRPARPGHFMLDLWRANEELLQGAGVDPGHLENPRLCTACHPELLFSYRKGSHGRLVTAAALP